MVDARELDEALARLRHATDRAGANLFALEQAPARELLAVADLEGESARRWAEAEQALLGLFPSYAALTTVVDAAVAARGARSTMTAAQQAEVARLVLGPSIELPDRAVPLDERTLLAESRVLRRCTPDELLAAMAAPFDLARSVILTAGEAWENGGPLVKELRERLAAVRATDGFDPDIHDAASIERRLRELAETIFNDPLSYEPAEAAALSQQVDVLAAAVAGAGRIHVELDAELEKARAELAALADASGMAAQHQLDAEARVRGLAPLRPPPLDTLGADLDRLPALGAQGAWAAVAAELADWRQRVEQYRNELARAAADQHAALERRRRLRGRLDAYTAKAVHLGRIEQSSLDPLRRHAEELLFRAPADLDEAEDAIQCYQQELDADVGKRSG